MGGPCVRNDACRRRVEPVSKSLSTATILELRAEVERLRAALLVYAEEYQGNELARETLGRSTSSAAPWTSRCMPTPAATSPKRSSSATCSRERAQPTITVQPLRGCPAQRGIAARDRASADATLWAPPDHWCLAGHFAEDRRCRVPPSRKGLARHGGPHASLEASRSSLAKVPRSMPSMC